MWSLYVRIFKNSGTRKGGVAAQFGLRQNRVVFVAQFQKIKNAAVLL
jgi:hypothetical protein